MARDSFYISGEQSRVLIIGVITPKNISLDADAYFNEFKSLVKTNGIEPTKEHFIRLRSVHPGTLLTKGKLEEVVEICRVNEIDEVVFSERLSPRQEHELSRALRADVYDRNHLILEIFEKNAHTAEGKMQVEIAFLEHKKARLSGRGVSMSQQSGRIGGKGPGETQKEIDLQHINHLLVTLKKDLARLQRVRQTQRKQRLKSKFPLVSLIGYTNAGKSTLLNQLTHSDILVEDKLFATLDTTTRELFIDGKKAALISDTVGFIQNLSHHLIEAFKSTLDELQYAELLLHVVDISNKDWERHIEVVHDILEQLGVSKKMLYIFNKEDQLHSIKKSLISFDHYQPHIIMSSYKEDDVLELKNRIKQMLIGDKEEVYDVEEEYS